MLLCFLICLVQIRSYQPPSTPINKQLLHQLQLRILQLQVLHTTLFVPVSDQEHLTGGPTFDPRIRTGNNTNHQRTTEPVADSSNTHPVPLPSPAEAPLPSDVMFKLLKNSITAHWCIQSGESSCFAQLPSLPADATKDLRYTCAAYVKKDPHGQQEWKGCTTQVNLFKKHAAARVQFDVFQEMFPISADSMRKRVPEVIPKLQANLLAYSSYLDTSPHGQRPKPAPKYDNDKLLQIQVDVHTKPAAAYWNAYSYGMGSAAGTRGAGVQSKPLRTPSPQHFQQPQHPRPPEGFHPPDMRPAPAPEQTPQHPALTLHHNVAQMYANATRRTQDFFHKQNPSVWHYEKLLELATRRPH